MKPILYNTPMVQAILENRKTATRRIIKGADPSWRLIETYYESVRKGKVYTKDIDGLWAKFARGGPGYTMCHAPYLPGDVLYVRETWRVGAWDIPRQLMAFDYADGTCGDLVHIEDREMFLHLVDQSREDARKAKCEFNGIDFVWKKGQAPTRWHPSIHMPKEAARIFLRVTNVRAERLWESFGDGYGQAERFQQEGITLPEECVTCIEAYGCPCCSDLDDSLPYDEQTGEDSEGGSECGMLDEVRNDFALLWESTVKPADLDRYGWAANPWAWVIEFERCEKPKEDGV